MIEIPLDTGRSSGVDHAMGRRSFADGRPGTVRGVHARIRDAEWAWQLLGGLSLLSHLFWYGEALAELPGSLRDPPEDYPPHWPLEFLVTGLAGVVLTSLGVRRVRGLRSRRRERRTRWTYQSTEDAMR